MARDDAKPELVPEIHQEKYSDGHPLDNVHYLECKIILKPERFTAKKGFLDFSKLVSHAAEKADMVVMARAFLDNPRWAWHAAEKMGVKLDYPPQYARSRHDLWPGAALARGREWSGD